MSAWGKLHAATLELARGTLLKQRLTVAFSKHLRELDASELPQPLRAEFLDIRRGLEAVRPMPGETAVQATVRKMAPDEADLYATRIVDLFAEFARSASRRGADDTPALNGFHDRPRERAHESGDTGNVIPLLYAAEA
jgi:hypothetical protein